MSRSETQVGITMKIHSAMQPTFMIVGAPKCGTTALYEYLQTHPQIFVTDPKEPHFYAQDLGDHRSVFTRAEYERLFAPAEPCQQAVGEASAWYLHSAVALPQVVDDFPDIRLIVMLRQPAEMLRSLHSDLCWICFEDEPDFEKAWALQAERQAGRRVPRLCQVPWFLQYRELGRLAKYTRRLLSLISPERVRIYLLDDLKDSPDNVYQDVLEFLGLESDGRTEFPRVNSSKRNRLQWFARIQSAVVRSLPRSYIQAGKRIGLGHLNRQLTRLNNREHPPNAVSAEFLCELIDTFHDEVCELEELLKRKLDHWKR